MEECKTVCLGKDCTAFFYQEHNNDAGCEGSPNGGYQICGYYYEESYEKLYK